MRSRIVAFAVVCLVGCPAEEPSQGMADADVTDAAVVDAAPQADGATDCDDLAAPCVSEFGSLFTRSNGRADGTLIALVRPQDTGCTLPNDDHAVLQLSILGHNQRLVVSVDDIAIHQVNAPLVGPPYEEGWHTDQHLDYPGDLGVASTDFTTVSMTEAVDFLCGELALGAPVSVYAYCDGDYPSSAHQIHRNNNYPDGAIVVHPDSASPTWLLFRYTNQSF